MCAMVCAYGVMNLYEYVHTYASICEFLNGYMALII